MKYNCQTFKEITYRKGEEIGKSMMIVGGLTYAFWRMMAQTYKKKIIEIWKTQLTNFDLMIL